MSKYPEAFSPAPAPQTSINFQYKDESYGEFAQIVVGACMAVISKKPKSSFWTSTKNKSMVGNAFGHYTKHKSEFPEFQNAKQYVEGTKKFLNNPPKGTLTKTRSNGDILLYNPKSNTFGVKDVNGTPRTMFRPDPGIDYWNKQ